MANLNSPQSIIALGRLPTILGRYVLFFSSLPGLLEEERTKFFQSTPTQQIRLPRLGDHAEANERSIVQPMTDSDVKKLANIVEQAQNILFAAKAVFPFQLFPDTITIDRQKLTVVHHTFFGARQTVSVPHSDITNIQADLGPFFGSLTVTSEHFINNTQTIEYLPKRDTLAIQQLIQGFIAVHKEGIDTSKIDDKTLIKLLDELGRGEAGERSVVQ